MREEDSIETTRIPSMSPLNYIEVHQAFINKNDDEELKSHLLSKCAGSILINPWILNTTRFREIFGKREGNKMRCLFYSTISYKGKVRGELRNRDLKKFHDQVHCCSKERELLLQRVF